MKHPFFLTFLILAIIGSTFATGCQSGHEVSHTFEMADAEQMPAEMAHAPHKIREAYQFAVANPDVLEHIPCYCGCGPIGHASNYDCYVAKVAADGTIEYDAHALICSICIDITQDTMKMLDEGRPLSEIRATIDESYSPYGPSNMP